MDVQENVPHSNALSQLESSTDNLKAMDQNGTSASKPYAADLGSIVEARKRIAPHIHITPVVTSSSLDALAGCKLFFKCELLQKGGAFKFRGACNAVLSLSDDDARKGVLTHSSGNHAAAVALAARMRGIPAHIIVPNNAPTCKLNNVKRYGGLITICEPTLQSREYTAACVQQDTGATLIHPFNDPRIISGQGTVALEFLEQVPDLDAIVVPISGGGLISGIALAAKALKPSIKIIAAEPSGADDAAQSKIAGYVIPMLHPNTIADGLRASLGDLTWPVLRDLVSEVVTVDDDEIISATKMCYEVLKLAVEPSGAIGLAAILSKKSKNLGSETKNIGIILSGGNVDLEVLWAAWKYNS
ncbi:serine racemase-like isoform X2 [Physcomitrium patens]